MTSLPRVMVAPIGARLGKAYHPAIPITIAEVVGCALTCQSAGAEGLHAHVRDGDGRHLLDVGLYAELPAELTARAPDLYAQVIAEAVGRYTPADQRRLVRRLMPAAVSIALREITAEPDDAVTRRFFDMCAEGGVGVQQTLFDEADIALLAHLVDGGVIPWADLKALVILGRYSTGAPSAPDDVARIAAHLTAPPPGVDWVACAFGPRETECPAEAARLNGKARVGFENNRLSADGSAAANNAERVARLASPELAIADGDLK